MDKLINIDKKILGGTPVFMGTRVPIETLFDHLEAGMSIDDFLQDFPTVQKEQAIKMVSFAGKLLSSKTIIKEYENIAG